MSLQPCGICFKAGCERQISGSGIPCISYEDRATIRADIGDAKFDAIDALAPLDKRAVWEAERAAHVVTEHIWPGVMQARCSCGWYSPSAWIDSKHSRICVDDEIQQHIAGMRHINEEAEQSAYRREFEIRDTLCHRVVPEPTDCQNERPNLLLDTVAKHADAAEMETLGMFTGGPLTTFENIKGVGDKPVDPELQALWNKYVAAIYARRINAADINTRLRLHGEFGELLSLVAAPDFVERETPFLVAQWGTVPTPFGMVVALTLRSEGRDGCWFWRLESIAEAWHGDMQSIHALFSDAEFRERHGISRDQPAAEAGSDFLAAVRDIARGS